MAHCEAVADFAQAINERLGCPVDPARLQAAAMLHDIGICLTEAPSIHCHGTLPYIAHGVAGGELLRREGAPEWAARVSERHTGAGLTAAEVVAQGLPIPVADWLPESPLERLVCYADKFFSKGSDDPARLRQPKSLEAVRASMRRHGEATAERFERLHNQFGADA